MVVKENSPRSFVGMRPNPKNFSSGDFSRTSSGRAYLPRASACQISRQASGTGRPSPSRTRPRMVTRSPPDAPRARSQRFSQARPMLKYGPTVCEGVVSPLISSLHGSGVAATQHNIKAEAECDLRCRRGPVEDRDEPLARGFGRHTVVNRVEFEKGITGKVHLRDEACGERGTKNGEVNVPRAPGVVMIAPRIRAGTNGDETVAALFVSEGLPHASEIGIERSIVLIHFVQITSGGIGLPNLHQRMSDRAAIFIHKAAADDDALAERLAFVLAGEIEALGRNDFFGKEWAGSFRKRVRKLYQGLRGRALDGGNVGWVQKLRLSAGGGPAIS